MSLRKVAPIGILRSTLGAVAEEGFWGLTQALNTAIDLAAQPVATIGSQWCGLCACSMRSPSKYVIV
ncbi:MAG: hypothetical protein PUP91_30255 [Rhizonema sp. PD37]|nr:hypothetical protein [Rhizonema sp. PD37]